MTPLLLTETLNLQGKENSRKSAKMTHKLEHPDMPESACNVASVTASALLTDVRPLLPLATTSNISLLFRLKVPHGLLHCNLSNSSA